MKGTPTVKLRIAFAALAATGVALGMTGCNLVTPQATTYSYNPSDGRNGNSGEVAVRNALLVVDPSDTTRASLNGTFVNDSDQAQPLSISVGGTQLNLQLEPGMSIFGYPDNQIVVQLTEAVPGQTVNSTITAGDGEALSLPLQVISTEAVGYEDLGPTAEPEGE